MTTHHTSTPTAGSGRTGATRRFATAAAGLVVTAAVLLGMAGVANASSSYVYTQPGHPWAYAYCVGAGCAPGDFAVPQRSSVTMICWVDGAWNPNGNYGTNRYFDVAFPGRPGWWAIQSSYVYNQVAVRHC